MTCGGCSEASAVRLFRRQGEQEGGGRGLGIVLQAAQTVNLSLRAGVLPN